MSKTFGLNDILISTGQLFQIGKICKANFLDKQQYWSK